MAPSFTIRTSSVAALVYLRVSGLFDPEQAIAFRQERDAALLQLTCIPDSHMTLCDVSDCLIQPKDTGVVFSRMIADPPRRSRRMAVVIGSALAQLQVKRWIAGRDEVAVFDDRSKATNWLCAEGADRMALIKLVTRR